MVDQWLDFGLDRVEIEESNVKMPVHWDQQGGLGASMLVVDGREIPLSKQNSAQVAYSASSSSGQGQLVYGHFGQLRDFVQLKAAMGEDYFTDNVVILRTNPKHDAGGATRMAERFGAKAVIFFPDPVHYQLDAGQTDNVSLSRSVAPHAGDPFSLYFGSSAAPAIPVASVAFNLAVNMTRLIPSKGMTEEFKYGLSLADEDNATSVNASLTVEAKYEFRQLNNVIGTIVGR